MVYRREIDEDEVPSGEGTDFAQLLDESFSKPTKKLKAGDRIKSEILSVGKEQVIVSTGTQHDGFVPKVDVLGEDGEATVKVGDVVDLYVTYVKGSQIFLSPKPTSKNLADDLEDAFRQGLSVEGRVESVINGGFQVNVMGKRAFCPISQLDSRRIDTPEEYIGKKFEFKVSQYSERGRNIVVSRRKIMDDQKFHSEATFFETHKVGSVISGTVSRMEKFGAFVEIAPGIDGLVHVSEISWSRVSDPKDVLEVGQQVTATILKIETVEGRRKISLSLKQSQAEPWTSMPLHITEGAIVEGKVTRCMKFGAFVEISAGIEGLVPLAEMSFTKRVARSDELFKEGEKISVKVKEIDAFARRISLSFREAEGQDPWSQVTDSFKVGSIVPGTVERREPFGLFVKIGEGFTGLLPKSRGLEAGAEFGYDRLKPGDSVKVRISEIKGAERRISLDAPNSANGAEDWQDYKAAQGGAVKEQVSNSPFSLLGSQLKAAIEKGAKK